MTGTLAEASMIDHARVSMEGDGVASQLFELLWKKDMTSGLSIDLRIPDTVLYKFNAPTVWYFTSVDGSIKRKRKEKVNSERIYQEFMRKASPSGIVAYFVADHREDVDELGRPPADPPARATVEYFDEEGLRGFLFNESLSRGNGFLQKFIHPKGDHNNMMRALWSPKVCVLERRVNRRKVMDQRLGVNERAVTFEGMDFHSETLPVHGSSLVVSVHSIAESMAEHVAAVTGEGIVISRLALNFKTDAKDRLWLLFASSVRLQDEFQRSGRLDRATKEALSRRGLSNSPLEIDAVPVVPAHALERGRAADACALRRCPTCAARSPPGGAFEISYRVLLEYEEFRAKAAPRRGAAAGDSAMELDLGAATGGGEPAVPQVIRRLHPRLTAEEFERHRHDAAFLHKVATVCEDCYLLYSSPQIGALTPGDDAAAPSAAPQRLRRLPSLPLLLPPVAANAGDLSGTGRLEPDRLRMRRDATLRKLGRRYEEEE
eukprot:CAMPEP_0176043216 /NCGR_PEP_ID=MMETSP0120_2-20121206/21445_1 /TAXON_ID=160619 /ORGANISM="Kryptoperidinium foliaceum, Strain CCMP 1326" /LENGTH=489 /DNA_ID=CAMNT_0017376623 /DNA_START=84 /DNA_END=1550 /DNA_ORIENTATION=+